MRRVFRLPFEPRRLAHEIDEELAFHIDMRAERLAAAGMSPEEARKEALRHFGAIDPIRQSCYALDEERERSMRRITVFADFVQDIRYALRTMRRNPGFAAVVGATIALGIGANTSIFTLVNALLLRRLPVTRPTELVAIGNTVRINSMSQGSARADIISWPLYRDISARNDVMTGVLATGNGASRIDVTIEGAPRPERARVRYVSANYFEVLGLRAEYGRLLAASDDSTIGAHPVAVISHGFWMRRFDGNASVVGTTVLMNGAKLTIVGVAPRGFTGEVVGDTRDFWVPLSMQPVISPTRKLYDDRGTSWLLLIGRLRPGITVDQARPRIAALIRRVLLDNDLPAPNALGKDGVRSTPVYVSSAATGLSRVRATFATPLVTLMIGVALLMLIVCANVANLLLARAVARGREMSVRLAMGGDAGRLFRQLLAECLVLGAFGAAGGLVIASWGSKLLIRAASDGPSLIPIDASLDSRVLLFTIGLSFLAVLLFGVAPAIRAARVDLSSTLRAGGRSVSGTLGARGRRLPLGAVLVSGQVALSLTLLAGTGLLVRSLRTLNTMDVGMARDRLLVVEADIDRAHYDSVRIARFAIEARDRIRGIAGVSDVTFSENGIFSGMESTNSTQVEGFRASQTSDTIANFDQIGPNYIRAIGGRLVAGRDFDDRDVGTAPQVALVNETFARFYFKNASAVGRHLYIAKSTFEIVGVIGDAKDHDLRADQARRMYFPYLRPLYAPSELRFEVLATGGDPASLGPKIRRQLAQIDPLVPVSSEAVSDLMRASVRDARLVTRIASAFGVIALLLASIGLYGVMSYSTARRTGEIGLRVALGAQRGQLLRMVIGDGLRLVVLGFVIGLPLSLLSVRLLKSQLYRVSPADPIALGAALVVLTASGVAAAFFPAARATRVSPTVALREE